MIPVLESPLLLGTTCSGVAQNVDDLAAMLVSRYRISDLEPLATGCVGHPFRLEVAAAIVGRISLTSVQGPAMALAVEPLDSTCLLALPSRGWGRYQSDQFCIDNTFGESVAFLPSCGWRLLNDWTGGTAIQFRAEELIACLMSMAPDALRVEALERLLSCPFILPTAEPVFAAHYRHLIAALAMVDVGYRFGGGEPHPMLCLDDLILRCVAQLVYPRLAGFEQARLRSGSRQDLRQVVGELMDWMTENLHRPISLTEIEGRVHYGRRAIQLGFRECVGCGPMQWLRRQRLESARRQLLDPSPDQTVTSVARSCGYLNLASFSRDFHDRFGIRAKDLLAESRLRLADASGVQIGRQIGRAA